MKLQADDLLKMKVSLFKKCDDNRPFATITLDDYLHKLCPAAKKAVEEIREVNKTDPKSAKAMKLKNLPAVSISAVFDGVRNRDNVLEDNPIFCIDIDELPFAKTWDEVKQDIFNLPYVFYVSLSARGEGLYALMYYNNKNDRERTFEAIREDFSSIGIEIDRACKDVSRLRFVSYDDSPLEKTGEITQYCKMKAEERKEYNIKSTSGNLGYSDKLTYEVIKYIITYCGYRSNTYDEWLLDGFRLATFKMCGGYELFMYLSSVSDNFNATEAEKKWKECVKSTTMTKDSLLHYYRYAKEHIGVDWKRKITYKD